MDIRFFRGIRPLLPFLLLLGSWSLFGFQETETDPDKLEAVDDYVRVVEEGKDAVPKTNTTALRLPAALQVTPSSVGVVPAALNEAQNNLILTDALRNVSGINVMTNFGVHDYFTVRGLDSLTGGLVLTDSAPEPEATFYHLYNIERVEVLKGPGAYAYGGNPLSGSVNLIRKQPVFDDFMRLNASYGRFDAVRGSLDTGVANAEYGLAFRMNAFWQENDGYRDDKANDATGLNPALAWKINEDATLSVNLEWAENNFQPDTGIPFFGDALAPVARTTSYQSPSDFSQQELLRLRVDYVNRINDRLTLRNRFYHTDLDWASHGSIFLAIAPNESGSYDLLRAQTQLDDRQKFTGNQLEAIVSLSAGATEHQLMVGLEWVRNSDLYRLDQLALLPIDLFNPVEFLDTPLDIPIAPPTNVDGVSQNYALYALDHIRFSEQVHLYLGARFDRIDYEAQDLINGVVSNDRTDNEVSPMFGLVYAPTEKLTVYANAGGGFSPPSTLILGDAEPEHSQQAEVGVKLRMLGGRLAATMAAFQLDREDIGIPDETGITQQAGDQRTEGLELELTANLGRGWAVHGAYAYTDSELTKFSQVSFFTGQTVDLSGNAAAFVPENLLNLWVAKVFGNGLGLAAGGRYVDSQFIAEDNQRAIEDYTVFDASVFFEAARWRAAINLKNLGDEEYETRGLNTPFVGSVIPSAPFEATGSVQLRF